MKVNRRVVFSIIRITFLLLVVFCVAKHYDDQCKIYENKMFEAMEERDQANYESVNLKNQISILEYKLSTNSEDYNSTSEELNAALAEVAWHEERWDILVKQKSGTTFSVNSTSGEKHFVLLSSYIGDSKAGVYHISNCDLLKAINNDDKIDLGSNIFSIRGTYKPCAWCLPK